MVYLIRDSLTREVMGRLGIQKAMEIFLETPSFVFGLASSHFTLD